MASWIARMLLAGGIAVTLSLTPAAASSAESGLVGWRLQAAIPVPGRDVVLSSVASDGQGDAWAVGNAVSGSQSEPVIFHWHGGHWLRVRLPALVLRVFGTSQELMVIGARSATDVWAFDALGHWMRFDGRRWTAGRLPQTTRGQAPSIHATVVLGSGDVWAFGSGAVPYAAHFSGRRWATTPVPGSTGITDASALTGRDIWAVNEQDVLRWNGHRWRVAAEGARLSPGFVLLTSVTARSGRSVWVGGGAANSAGGKTEATARWNGHSWRVAQLPAAPTAAPFEITSLVPDGHGGLWGLGTSNSLGGWRLWQLTATRWQAVARPVSQQAAFSTLASNLAWQPSTGSAWAAGWMGTSPRQQGMILRAGPAPGGGARTAGPAGSSTDAHLPPGTVRNDGLNYVACLSPSRCVAVGNFGLAGGVTKTLAEERNGTSWRIMTTPDLAGTSFARLDAVTCTAISACLAVGADQVGSGPVRPVAEQLSGGRWRIRSVPDPAGTSFGDLRGVSCPGPRDCLAVGSATTTGSGRVSPLAEQWNGSRWRMLRPFRPAGDTFTILNAITCSTPAMCLAGGTTEKGAGVSYTLIESWDGTRWRRLKAPTPAGAQGTDIIGMACPSRSACLAVGESRRPAGSAPVAEIWSHGTWRLTPVPSPAGAVGAELFTVSCTSTSDCVGVGTWFTNVRGSSLAVRWNGTRWRLLTVPDHPGAESALFGGVACAAARACTVVGTFADSSGSYLSLAEGWDGRRWALLSPPSP